MRQLHQLAAVEIDACECNQSLSSYDFSQSLSPLKLNSKQPIRAAVHDYFQESSEPCSTPLPAPAATRD